MHIILATQEAEGRGIHGWKPAWANSGRYYLEKTLHKKGLAQGIGLEFKPVSLKKKKKKKKF
jgi:hypothetical protein